MFRSNMEKEKWFQFRGTSKYSDFEAKALLYGRVAGSEHHFCYCVMKHAHHSYWNPYKEARHEFPARDKKHEIRLEMGK
ncbi:hypothetical protein HN51_052695 [Arachis hypogaea]